MFDLKKYIKEEISKVGIDLNNVDIVRPPKENMGDFALPCFTLDIEGCNNPHEKAQKILQMIHLDKDVISNMSVVGPYLNFFVNKDFVAIDTLTSIMKKKEKYGSSNEGEGKDLLIEHTSINPNASPHIGRTRNSIIGDFLVNLYKFQGYNVETHYFINDIGKQISMLLVGVEDKYDDLSKVTFDDMLSLYVEINEKSKKDSNIEKKVFNYLNELENGNESVREKFKDITNICINGQKEIFSKMNIEWDVFKHESDFVFEKTTENILNRLKDLGKLKEDENGRYYVDLSGYDIPTKNPVLVLTREDKTSLYPLRDIAYTIYKESINSDNNFIVLGEDQEVYMKQIAAVMDIMGYKAPDLVSYNFVLLNGDKMATREGKVVLLEDFIKEAKKRIKQGFEERNGDYDDAKVSSIAASCIKYSMLNVNRKRNVNFNLDEAVNFQGDSAMYLLYNYARICSILDKSDKKDIDLTTVQFKEDLEHSLISSLYDFSEIIKLASDTQESVGITNYLHDVAQKFSKYYKMIPILSENDEIIRTSRLALLKCTRTVLENGMNVLGIEPVKKL